MVRSLFSRDPFGRDFFAEFDRLQRDMGGLFGPSPTIRGLAGGGYPALNVSSNAQEVEVLAFAPGVDPATLDIQLDRGVLSIAGERAGLGVDDRSTVHRQERFAGRFRRVVSMPDDVDADNVSAECRDGVLRIRAARKAAAQPRRISVQ